MSTTPSIQAESPPSVITSTTTCPTPAYHDVKIQFNRPSVEGRELEYVNDAIATGWISGDGVYTHKCNQLIEKLLNVNKVLLTTNCTHALEMSAVLLNIQPGDEVIVPSFTFVSTINAFVLRGAKPVFIDIRPDTLNMDERLLEGLITEKTKAIVCVHYAGVACEMDVILEVANRHGIAVVEDNAHGFLGKYKGKFLGSFGVLATQSFHETKNFACGEGGALIINDPALALRAEIIREKGTNRSSFLRGETSKYSWVDVGSSWLPSELVAAYLYGQLEVRDKIQRKRQWICDQYRKSLESWALSHQIRLPHIPEHCQQTYHMFYLLFPSHSVRQALRSHLRKSGILACSHYEPLHSSDMGQSYGFEPSSCPITQDYSQRLLRLPLYNSLSEEDLQSVINAILSFPFDN